MKKIECIIMDWAGTAVDYGCFAPVAAFLKSFESIGIAITPEEARRPMGLTKIDHIRTIFQMERIHNLFNETFKREYTEDDINKCYDSFQKELFSSLENYTSPIPYVIETIENLKAGGIKIGSTTGYTREMMDVVIPGAAQKGYKVDNCVTSDNLPGGRPHPYMIYQNMIDLAVESPLSVIKYGDTIADIKEGLRAGVWTIGVINGSNEMGLTEEEMTQMAADKIEKMRKEVRKSMYQAGAHYVVDDIRELPEIMDAINNKMNN